MPSTKAFPTGTSASSAERLTLVARTSLRASWDLTPNTFESALQRRRSDGLPLLDLIQSNPTTIGIVYPELLGTLSSPAALRYSPSPFGLSEARHAVARWYQRSGIDVDARRVVLTASSSEAYAYLLKLLCDPGDSILVPRPSYPLFDQLARLESVEVLRYPLVPDDGWRIDVEGLRSMLRPDTRAIFVVSPNNPTGSVLREDERRAIEQVAREHDLALVCDEVFAEYVWSPCEDRVSCAAIGATVPTFTLGGLSKSAGLPQMKLGWMIVGGPERACEDLMSRIEMIADTYLSVSAPVQVAAERMLEAAGSVRAQIAARIRGNLTFLEERLAADSPVTACAVDAGWYVPLRVPAVMTDEAWASLLVERDGVVVHPGSFFRFEREGTLIAGLIAPAGTFRAGIDAIERRISRMCA